MFPGNFPKVLHVFWDKSSRLSYMHYMTLQSFRKLNPDFEIVVHTSSSPVATPPWDTSEQKTTYSGPDYFDLAMQMKGVRTEEVDLHETFGLPTRLPIIYKADIVRLWTLSKFGGVWSDMDVLWLKSMAHLPIWTPEYSDVSVARELPEVITTLENGSTGVICAQPKTPYYRELLSRAVFRVKNNEAKRYQSIGPSLVLELGKDTQMIESSWNTRVLSVPYDTFYPVGPDRAALIFKSPDYSISSYSMAIHWYGGYHVTTGALNQWPSLDKMPDSPIKRKIQELM